MQMSHTCRSCHDRHQGQAGADMSTIAERVAAGAVFLDEHDPDWWRADVERAINLDLLELSEPQDCILGQRCPVTVLAEFCYLNPTEDEDELSAESWRAYTAYAIKLSGLQDYSLAEWGDAHGFSDGAAFGFNYDSLTAEWKRVITERRADSLKAER